MELINRISLLKRVVDTQRNILTEPMSFDQLLEMIGDEPMVDAVPVVRCKDCRHKRVNAFSKESMIVYCPINYTVKQYDDFCSYGEKGD